MQISDKPRKEYPANAFIDNFRNFHTGVENASFNEPIIISTPHNSYSFVYKNCTFQSDLTFSMIQLGSVHFIDCTFQNLKFEDISISSITLTNCEGKTLLVTSKNLQTVKIENGSKFSSINIVGGIVEAVILDSIFDYLEIDSNQSPSLKIHNFPSTADEIVTGSYLLVKRTAGFINIQNVRLDVLDVKDCSITQSIDMSNSQINSVEITESTVHSLNFRNLRVNSLLLTTVKLRLLSVVDGEYGTITIGRNSVTSYKLETSASLLLKIDVLKLADLSLERDSNLTIRRLDCSELLIGDLSNSGKVEISDTIVKRQFSFERSNLGDAIFKNLNLQNCEAIKTLNSSFTNAKFFNVQWRRDYRIHEYEDEISRLETTEQKVTDYYYPLRESYRQLISVSNKELNKIDSLFFQKQELRIYFEIIKFDKWKSWVNFQDYLVLGSNKLFSDFGQNIWLPLQWWIPIHLILFNILLFRFNLGITIVPFSEHSWSAFFKGLGIFLNLLSPVHSSLVYEQSIYGVTDFLMRVVSGYFIYYFISATRKYHLQK